MQEKQVPDEEQVNNLVRNRRVRSAIRFFAVGRITIGSVFLAAPRSTVRRFISGYRSPGEAVTLGRMAAGRDLALGLGTLLASWSHSDAEFEWLIAGLIADAVDVYAFTQDDSFRLIPRILSALVAGGAVGLGVWTLLNVNALGNDTPDDETASESSHD